MSIAYQIVGAFGAKQGAKGNYRGKVTFAFVPPALQPLKVMRTYVPKDKNGNERKREDGKPDYREVVELEIEPGSRVTVKDAPIMISAKGEAYVRTSLDIPWDLSTSVARDALNVIDERRASKEVA